MKEYLTLRMSVDAKEFRELLESIHGAREDIERSEKKMEKLCIAMYEWSETLQIQMEGLKNRDTDMNRLIKKIEKTLPKLR